MFVIKHKALFFLISGLLVVLSVSAIAVWGLPLGVDFTGGSVLEMRFADTRPPVSDIEAALAELGIGNASVRETGTDGYIIRTLFLEEETREELVTSLGGTVERFSSVGPTIGAELRRKALIAIGLVVLLIILYIAFVFRGVAAPRGTRGASPSTSLRTGRGDAPSSWKYGVAAIIALVHDIIIPTGVIVVLGRFAGANADTLFIMALLAIMGLSVNDTIVVFDRIRENLALNKDKGVHEPFERVVGTGLEQTYTRSINTSLTTLLVLLALFFVGGPTIHNFVLTLIVGMIAGTYSSIFLASPLLVLFAKSTSK